jgi:hypothetical protein
MKIAFGLRKERTMPGPLVTNFNSGGVPVREELLLPVVVRTGV